MITDTLLTFSQSFFQKLHVDIKSIEIIKEKDFFYTIKLQSDDSAILIGEHGANIDSLQKIISMTINREATEKLRVKLEINDYYKSKDEKLFSYIEHKISILEKQGGEYKLPKYTPYERKKIHFFVSKLNKGIITKSKGEGEDRRLFLIKKSVKKKLTIDIDGDNI